VTVRQRAVLGTVYEPASRHACNACCIGQLTSQIYSRRRPLDIRGVALSRNDRCTALRAKRRPNFTLLADSKNQQSYETLVACTD
jgi:hypothetical protein